LQFRNNTIECQTWTSPQFKVVAPGKGFQKHWQTSRPGPNFFDTLEAMPFVGSLFAATTEQPQAPLLIKQEKIADTDQGDNSAVAPSVLSAKVIAPPKMSTSMMVGLLMQRVIVLEHVLKTTNPELFESISAKLQQHAGSINFKIINQ
jgi:hypothetical protein